MRPHQPDPPPPPVVVVVPPVVVVVPAMGDAAGDAFVVVVVVVEDEPAVAPAAGLAAGLEACASAIPGIMARAAANTRPAAPLPNASFIRAISLLSSACTGPLTRSSCDSDGTAGCFRE